MVSDQSSSSYNVSISMQNHHDIAEMCAQSRPCSDADTDAICKSFFLMATRVLLSANDWYSMVSAISNDVRPDVGMAMEVAT